MKTLPLNELRLRVIYLEPDPVARTNFIYAFGQQVSISSFKNLNGVVDWLMAGNEVDLVIMSERLDWLSFLETVQANAHKLAVQLILISPLITSELCRQASRVGVVDIFPTDYIEEDIRMRFDYLIRKKAYYNSHSVTPETTWLIQTPIWKRAIDLVASVSALTILSPVMVVATVLIRLDSPGPILYKSRRVGAGYRIFEMYKFRSMRTDADKLLSSLSAQNIYNTKTEEIDYQFVCEDCQRAGTECKQRLFLMGKPLCEKQYIRSKKKAAFTKFRDDPRVTRLGRFLRNSSIDELPQLINILKGDMSLVGNRPLPLYEAEKLTKTGYIQRFAAPAGLTGLWQVMKRAKGQPVMSDHERIQLDIQYARTLSLKTDLMIMFKTFVAIWQKENV
ncbi:sugar transferase [Spirosoma validum]|uniref:Sugar transferase n=1 Tax=Spirosoma validum TaxID=2771355 RepID=A0A927GG15_9BACT|nr:sugar transferase [Spirosoma validum]MBD2756233.1 sugar transferase [Spirosoma validum]